MNNTSDMVRQVAIVEDEPALRENYRLALEKAGYSVEVYADRQSAWEKLREHPVDLVIIDVGLGHDSEGGFELCRDLRSLSSALPILILTARDSELDVISGLRLGADDYLTKDISLAHLTARVRALLRRTSVQPPDAPQTNQITTGGLSADSDRIAASWNGTNLSLTVTEFWLVYCLIKHPGQVKTRQQLMDAANVVLDDQTITAHVKRIRKKFVALDPGFEQIQTVYGMGYRWVDKE